MIDYKRIVQSTSMREIAEQYGFEIKRGGVMLCPFHPDSNPSCKLYAHSFYCFACGRGGDVINFVAGIKNISNSEVAELLSGGRVITAAERYETNRKKKKTERFDAWEHDAWQSLLFYRDMLHNYKLTLRHPHELFVKALIETENIEYLIDIFTTGTREEKISLYADEKSRRRINDIIQYTSTDGARSPGFAAGQ